MHTIKNESGLYLYNENTTMAGQVAGHSIDGFEPDGDVFLWTYDQVETLRLAESDDFMAKCARSARDYYSWEWRWRLDTDTDGCDETLYGLTREDVLADICHYHDIDEMPAHWTLTRAE